MLFRLVSLFILLSHLPLQLSQSGNGEGIVGRFGDSILDAAYIADYKSIQLFLRKLREEEEEGLLSNKKKMNVNAVDSEGRNALHICGLDPQEDRLAVDDSCRRIAMMLKSAGTNMNAKENNGMNAVHYGAANGFSTFVSFLCGKGGVPCDEMDAEGRTPLLKAVAHGFNDTFHALYEVGANVHIKDSDGLGILHCAVRLIGNEKNDAHRPFLMELLNLGMMSVDMKDNSGRTPLMYAALNNDIESVSYLLKYGADPRIQDVYEVTAARMTKNRNIFAKLAEAAADYAVKEHELWMLQQQQELDKSLEEEGELEFQEFMRNHPPLDEF